jgi:hypothetical protein
MALIIDDNSTCGRLPLGLLQDIRIPGTVADRVDGRTLSEGGR